jgi:hypothetical protein
LLREMAPHPVDERGEKSADALRDEGLLRMLRMKPKRHEDMKVGKPRKKKTEKKPANKAYASGD